MKIEKNAAALVLAILLGLISILGCFFLVSSAGSFLTILFFHQNFTEETNKYVIIQGLKNLIPGFIFLTPGFIACKYYEKQTD